MICVGVARDLFDERGVKLVLLAYLSLSPIYVPLSELEPTGVARDQGFSDLFLGLDGRFPDAKYTWLVELKYLNPRAGPVGAKAAQIEAAREKALAQLEAYLQDEKVLRLVKGERRLRGATLVVVGMKKCHWRLEREV